MVLIILHVVCLHVFCFCESLGFLLKFYVYVTVVYEVLEVVFFNDLLRNKVDYNPGVLDFFGSSNVIPR